MQSGLAFSLHKSLVCYSQTVWSAYFEMCFTSWYIKSTRTSLNLPAEKSSVQIYCSDSLPVCKSSFCYFPMSYRSNCGIPLLIPPICPNEFKYCYLVLHFLHPAQIFFPPFLCYKRDHRGKQGVHWVQFANIKLQDFWETRLHFENSLPQR